VVVDDAEQGMSDIVRGADLLVSTPRQIHVQRCLGLPTPDYCHLPLLVNAAGEKLSKQTLAPAINPGQVVQELRQALCRLGQCRRPMPDCRRAVAVGAGQLEFGTRACRSLSS
jgi:glutamyl-Q tRNA(Asp) synthetase